MITPINFIRLILVSIILAYLTFCTILFSELGLHPTKRECGIVKSKFNEEISIKHGTKTELYLMMQFKTFEKAIEVDVLTYSKAKVNDTLCFNIPIELSNFYHISLFLGLLVTIIMTLIMAVIIIMFILYGKELFK